MSSKKLKQIKQNNKQNYKDKEVSWQQTQQISKDCKLRLLPLQLN
jgi:hypothetical protein